MYTSDVLDHFRSPRNGGVLEGANARGRADNPGCGDEVELTLRIECGRIGGIRFRASGCVAAIACASRLTELVQQLPLAEARRIEAAVLAAALGGLPPASGHAAQLSVDALRAALAAAAPAPGPNTVPT